MSDDDKHRLYVFPDTQMDAEKATALATCQDCTATVHVEEMAPNVFSATVEHDDSCPFFRSMQ